MLLGGKYKIVLDGRRLPDPFIHIFNTDPSSVFLAYDGEHCLLVVLHVDFDHYCIETQTTCYVFHIDGDEIFSTHFYSDWLKGIRMVPHGPFSFK